ncbi:hypothetical protein GEU84_017555 [Fertoebacter nigrum]|uniref:Uncharacterized protein n=1 Tax=Fertoeibacter niger TaxID=2656921 RepID=A0A8X8GXP0_9RHOB|nr:hypothetical protein [Fertoeibacter niger]NUB46203.1 hypothetical protein [Fertoeibacter niger]
MEHATPLQANNLKNNLIGLGLLVFLVVSAAGPLAGTAGAIPIAMLAGIGAGVPGTFVIMAVIMPIAAFGLVALARRIRDAGACHAHSARTRGGEAGGTVALIGFPCCNEPAVSARALVSLGVVIGLIAAFAIVAKGGAGDLAYSILDPNLIFAGGGMVAAILFTFGARIRIEATAICTEELRDPDVTVPKATQTMHLTVERQSHDS